MTTAEKDRQPVGELNKDRVPDESFFQLQMVKKQVDDLLWYQRLGHRAEIDIHRIAGQPPANTLAQDDRQKGNHIVFSVYTFIPRELDKTKKHPFVLLVHGGVHADFGSAANTHIVEELLDEGYVVVAPDYRGSSGYGELHYKLIDYGGLETEDIYTARCWALERYDFLDPQKVGIAGWSHGGMITLMNLFFHPEAYQAAFAGVPVSDLVTRMGYNAMWYVNQFAADYHIGKYPWEDPQEYLRRSPAWNVEKFRNTPLLIHTNTSDEDVHVLEVKQLIKALKAEGKQFRYTIFEEMPGGHLFDRLDTSDARKIRRTIWDHLAEHLK